MGVRTESNLVKSFLQAARQMAENYQGQVKFPKVLQFIRYEDSGRRRDSSQNVMQDLVLKWGAQGG